ncbi:hypothetical protein BD324DRAFT_614549 [Kockovaella imperatae]|uniref:HTH APSES-type domain-containing protein n=1 Tax=Kockovaella imperatae TaxID=4999 RepID=A0A1Y1UNP4_9TREE|nr:hypothetical protein BD324DRAFT_614549 [Kockovaella imperatae]ORX39670.1 hypothetical protein BD324DRAFT_614549 [Kockovaella imperatae]
MGKKPVVAGTENGPNTIYKATYSGVPVYEMLCRTVAVMRRRSDAYLNATQILKVAGFDKPQRTRVLEREVQKGEHEKVQGGYGKYQGTWIPIERGLALAKQYGVEDLLRPIIDYVPTSVSPPPAPKHVVAPPTKTKKDKEGKGKDGTPLKTGPMSAAALQAQAQLAAQRNASGQKKRIDSTPDDTTMRSAEDSLTNSPEDDDSSSDTPSPVASPRGEEMEVDGVLNGIPASLRKRNATIMLEEDDQYAQLQRARGQSAVHTPHHSPRALGPGLPMEPMGPDQYADIILTYFVSETTQIPPILVAPPPDFDPNAPIDEDGHTALHWACAMGRVRVVKLLLTAGASIFTGNNAEQTPLMRSVMFGNNYDVRKFPELYELLHRSTLNIDKHNRTVFHHIANLALTKGKTHAARYYMETILSRLSDYPQELADVINFQDEDGETALTLAARARSRRLVKALLDHGADPKIKNRDFKSAEDYILEDERFRSSPVQAGGSRGSLSGTLGDRGGVPQLFNSDAARMAGGSCLADITAHMQSLARSFDLELQSKERDILQAKALLTNIHAEVTEASRVVKSLADQTGPMNEARQELGGLEAMLKAKLSTALRGGWEMWNAGQEGREARHSGGGIDGESYNDLDELVNNGGDEDTLTWSVQEKRKRREELVDRYTKALAESGTGDKIEKYRRLIAAGCGGSLAPKDVDNVMTQLLETLENETTLDAGLRSRANQLGNGQTQATLGNVQWMP